MGNTLFTSPGSASLSVDLLILFLVTHSRANLASEMRFIPSRSNKTTNVSIRQGGQATIKRNCRDKGPGKLARCYLRLYSSEWCHSCGWMMTPDCLNRNTSRAGFPGTGMAPTGCPGRLGPPGLYHRG